VCLLCGVTTRMLGRPWAGRLTPVHKGVQVHLFQSQAVTGYMAAKGAAQWSGVRAADPIRDQEVVHRQSRVTIMLTWEGWTLDSDFSR
jgi:hypothetical protein